MSAGRGRHALLATLVLLAASLAGAAIATLAAAPRYIRRYGTARATQWGYALWEFRVHGR